ncbi:sensor histidine kinase [Scytonema sp. NUACC26]|uniref:sensor histidine kinase n=1 Tax=Scytonema sp. NUACC26 TaxID=3140176 RepID=UPI0034DBAF32
MQVTTEALTQCLSPSLSSSKTDFQSSQFSSLQSFCQLQIEFLLSKSSIEWARIVYYDPFLLTHQTITQSSQEQWFTRNFLSYINSEEWLVDFYHSFTLNEINFSHYTSSKCYICPLGYRNQKPEYILIFTREPLSLSLQQDIKQTAMILSKHLDICSECYQQKTEIQLLEQILQRAGHQLRHPLAMIGLYAENLYLKLPKGSTQEQAAIIRESIKDLDANLTELIYCGQKEKIKVTLQDLKSLISESIQGLKPLIEQKNLKVCHSETSAILAIDRLQMKQVFDNLLSNAVYFSPMSGVINCHWQIFQNEVLIWISDQGKGLSPEDIKKIFTPFYSRRPGGTGLGLTIAKKIVLDHYGSLWAQNSSEGGAQFFISLPRSTSF